MPNLLSKASVNYPPRLTGRVFAVLLAIFIFSASAFAQDASQARINIQRSGISVIEALKEVEQQSGLSVGFNNSKLEGRQTSLNLSNADLSTSLSQILKGTGYTYEISGNFIKIVGEKGAAAAGNAKASQGALETITGQVIDPEGEPLIGATVAVKGTSTATSTDIDGNFTLKARPDDTLLFTYIGYAAQEHKVGANTTFDITMSEDSKMLDEVVVTALGIKREQKSLSYNVQQLKGDVLSENKDANFINGLAGKVAGVNINASSSGVGGISKVVMRGTKSIMQSSNALYVVDGMPMRGANSGGSTEFGSQGSTEPIADLNPEDIESVINTNRFVQESIVTEQDGHLIALIHFDTDAIVKHYEELKLRLARNAELLGQKKEEIKKEIKEYVNSKVTRFSRISDVIENEEEFEKTPTRKIRRFLYEKRGKKTKTPEKK